MSATISRKNSEVSLGSVKKSRNMVKSGLDAFKSPFERRGSISNGPTKQSDSGAKTKGDKQQDPADDNTSQKSHKSSRFQISRRLSITGQGSDSEGSAAGGRPKRTRTLSRVFTLGKKKNDHERSGSERSGSEDSVTSTPPDLAISTSNDALLKTAPPPEEKLMSAVEEEPIRPVPVVQGTTDSDANLEFSLASPGPQGQFPEIPAALYVPSPDPVVNESKDDGNSPANHDDALVDQGPIAPNEVTVDTVEKPRLLPSPEVAAQEVAPSVDSGKMKEPTEVTDQAVVVESPAASLAPLQGADGTKEETAGSSVVGGDADNRPLTRESNNGMVDTGIPPTQSVPEPPRVEVSTDVPTVASSTGAAERSVGEDGATAVIDEVSSTQHLVKTPSVILNHIEEGVGPIKHVSAGPSVEVAQVQKVPKDQQAARSLVATLLSWIPAIVKRLGRAFIKWR